MFLIQKYAPPDGDPFSPGNSERPVEAAHQGEATGHQEKPAQERLRNRRKAEGDGILRRGQGKRFDTPLQV